jgi:gas vesicle protein
MQQYPMSQIDTPGTSRRVVFFLVGAALGALVAAVMVLLYAPHSGEETRELLAERGRELGQRARGGGDEFIRRVRQATDEWAAQLQAAADDLVAGGRLTPEE